MRLIQCLPTSNKNLKENFLIFSGEWHDGLPCPREEGEPGENAVIDSQRLVYIYVFSPFFLFFVLSLSILISNDASLQFNDSADRRSTKPRLSLVNKASLDRVLKAETYVNEADGQLRAAHLILGYTPLSFAFQAPKYVIRARDPWLYRISVAYKGFVVPEGIPFPKNTSRTKPLFVAAISTGAFSFQPVLKEGEVEEKEEEEEEEVVELSDSSDDFGIFDQPIRSEEDLDEMGIQRKPQRSLMELIENQPRKNAPGKPTQSQILSLPTRSPPPTPHQPLQPVRADVAELKRRKELKGKDVVNAGKSRPTREEDAQRATKQ